jgi:hypothetical protein
MNSSMPASCASRVCSGGMSPDTMTMAMPRLDAAALSRTRRVTVIPSSGPMAWSMIIAS